MPDLWNDSAVTTMQLTVSYSHDRQGWMAGYTVVHRNADLEATSLGSAQVEFGPFDSFTEVGYWLAGLTKVLRTMTADKPIHPTL